MSKSEEMIKTSDFSIIQKHIESANQKDLVIFDVDEVLLTTVDRVLKHNQFMYEKIETLAKQEDIHELYSIVFKERNSKPVDKKYVQLIKNLQNKQVKTIALTNCYTEAFGKISSMKDWRINELKNLGYYFDRSWEDIYEVKFEQLITGEAGVFPTFKQGVLFTNDLPKGDVLKAFLDYSNFKPKQIIFIDDRQEYLESVAEITNAASIQYLAIWYTAVADKTSHELCKELAEFQIETLVKERRWLSDKEAEELYRQEE